MPRDLYLRLNIPIPNHKGYRFNHSTGTLLKSAGWNVVKETRKFSYLKPPYELAPARTTDIKTAAPTDDEILTAAQDFHQAAVPARKMLHAFPAYYRPASATSYSTSKVNPVTGEKSPADQSLLIPAAFRIGLWGIWEAEVYWNADAQPILVKHPHQEISPPDPTLFDLLSDTDQLETSSSLTAVATEITAEAREACIAHHGLSCTVCAFDFASRYGELGQGFILIHSLSQSPATHPIDPIKDLRPICANCQAMLQRATPPLTFDALKLICVN